MKRLITCAALLLVAGVVVFHATREMTATAGNERVLSESNQAYYSRVEGAALRRHYVERLKAKAELMSDEEIKAALETTDGEIRALEAESRLTDASEILTSIVKEYEGTNAAHFAKQMLAVYGGGDLQNPIPRSIQPLEN